MGLERHPLLGDEWNPLLGMEWDLPDEMVEKVHLVEMKATFTRWLINGQWEMKLTTKLHLKETSENVSLG
jgi:hypothetical protein